MKQLSLLFVLILSTFALSCTKYKSSELSLGATLVEDTISQIVTISGSVISTTGSAREARALSRTKDARPVDDCSGANWAMSYVGGGGDVVVSGSANADGEFTIPDIPALKEAIITFDCNGTEQKCLAKAGDAGIECNAIADGVIGALEQTLGASLTATSFLGKSVAKMGSAIVDSSKADSTEADALRSEIATCRALGTEAQRKACYKSAIENSSFAGNLKVMEVMASEWSVESLILMLTDTLGFNVEFDDLIFTGFGNVMDTAFESTFVAESRTFINNMVSNPENYLSKIECRGSFSKTNGGGAWRFPPTQTVNADGIQVPNCKNHVEYAKIGIPAEKYATLDAAIDAGNGGDAVQIGSAECTNSGGWGQANYFCVWKPNIIITAKNKEVDRNDPDGTNNNRGDDSDWQRSISFINVFPELMRIMMQNSGVLIGGEVCMDFRDNRGGDPIFNYDQEACRNWSINFFRPYKKYFSGLMGLYFYLRNPQSYASGGSAKLSLAQIHAIFTDPDFLGTKLSMWSPSYRERYYIGSEYNMYVPALIKIDPNNGRLVAPNLFKQETFGQELGNLTYDELTTAVNESGLPYNKTFQEFEHIPTSTEIHEYIYGQSHHEDWNPFGQKYFWTPAVQNTGLPVFCRMFNKVTGKSINTQLGSNTQIFCVDNTAGYITTPYEGDANKFRIEVPAISLDGGITIPAYNGTIVRDSSDTARFTVPLNFPFPFVLQQRGWMGDSIGKIFALADRRTGMNSKAGDVDIFVVEAHEGNTVENGFIGNCTTTEHDGNVIQATIQYYMGNEIKKELQTSYCLDMSKITASGRTNFYRAEDIVVNEQDSMGHTWTNNYPTIAKVDATGRTLPVCFFTPSNYFAIDEQDIATTAVGTIDNETIIDPEKGELEVLGAGTSIALCSTEIANTTKYNLLALDWDGVLSGERANLKGYIMDSNTKKKINYRPWQEGDMGASWTARMLYIKIGTMETALSSNVAPTVPVTFLQNIKMLNSKHNAKFDPYCDDLNNNGKCDCFAAGTTNLITNRECTLLDDAAEPTLSSKPYWADSAEAQTQFINFFNTFGGKAGGELIIGGNPATPLNGQYFYENQLHMNQEELFICQHKKKVDGVEESFFRRPTQLVWQNFANIHQPGCPDSDGNIVAADNWQPDGPGTGGGPVRLVNPKPMKNAYDVSRPNTLQKIINYATKSTGQGVNISSTQRLFTFDEAMALISLRFVMPLTDPVYSEEGVELLDARTEFRKSEFTGMVLCNRPENEAWVDIGSAVLMSLVRPTKLQSGCQ